MSTQIIPLLLFKKITVAALLLFISIAGNTQQLSTNEPAPDLPKAFSRISDSSWTEIVRLDGLFSKKAGETVQLDLGNQTVLEGVVEAIASKYDDRIVSVSVTVFSPQALLLTFSKIKTHDKGIIYRGLISGKNAGDCLEMVQDKDQLKFIKRNINYLRSE